MFCEQHENLKYKVGDFVKLGYLDPSYDWDDLDTGAVVEICLCEAPRDGSTPFYHVKYDNGGPVVTRHLVGDAEIDCLVTFD